MKNTVNILLLCSLFASVQSTPVYCMQQNTEAIGLQQEVLVKKQHAILCAAIKNAKTALLNCRGYGYSKQEKIHLKRAKRLIDQATDADIDNTQLIKKCIDQANAEIQAVSLR